MSGIHTHGPFQGLLKALARYPEERYEGTSGCEHLMKDGKWLHDAEAAKGDIMVYNERDTFGPGEINIACKACDEKEQNTFSCDWCHKVTGDVSGYTDPETHEEYMVCGECESKDRAAMMGDE